MKSSIVQHANPKVQITSQQTLIINICRLHTAHMNRYKSRNHNNLIPVQELCIKRCTLRDDNNGKIQYYYQMCHRYLLRGEESKSLNILLKCH